MRHLYITIAALLVAGCYPGTPPALSLATLPAGPATGILPAPAAIAGTMTPAAAQRSPVTILISIDGFHPSYLERGVTPNLNALADAGAKAEMRPSFPTKTFPNHYTIVTGLRPDSHGIVGNNIEDAARPGVWFSLGNHNQSLDPFWWDGAEPIWVTAEKQGIRTATMFWPGSEVPIRGTRPSDWQRFDMAVTNVQRVAAVVDWMRRPPATRPRFVTLYFDTVDTAGHEFGPVAPETMAAVAEVDERIGALVEELDALGQPANIVVVSDHGLAETNDERLILLGEIVDLATIRIVADGAYAGIEPVEGREAEAAAALLKPHPNMECWRKSGIPERFDYGDHPRVPAIVCLPRTGWLIVAAPPEWDPNGGNHGYDNQAPEMLATFIASGPAFRAGETLPTIDNVDIYPLLADLVGVDPLPNDGNATRFEKVLVR